MTPLELWAGPECTVNRVGPTTRDQLEETGFAARLDDLDRLADLGIRCIRFPILWERTQRNDGGFDWAWCDARLERMARLGLRCIAGLVHHGSGPPATNLLDAGFAPGLARFAGEVARRYPQLDRYTPVNEPLTTARFSGLYGLWYPHGRSDACFVRALLNQVQAIRSAMQAIRRHAPHAHLVQTDDLGFTHAAPALQYQADFENARRWLAFDLLAGRVVPSHRMWSYLRRHGAARDELLGLVDKPCLPDVIGINCYVTSERYLDDRLALYPVERHGGNRRHRYVDTESVRVRGAPLRGPAARLREAWERYGQPVALTEAHIGCTREEQMRWLNQAWQGAVQLKQESVDVRAVTAWAAFGTVDWDSLVTRRAGHYEPGLWDSRSTPPRPTGLATLARALAQGTAADHPVLQGAGWWQRKLRHHVPVVGSRAAMPLQGPVLLIVGAASGRGGVFARLCRLRGLPFHLVDAAVRPDGGAVAIDAALTRLRPWAAIDARKTSSGATEALAERCASLGIPLVAFSTDQVFAGDKADAYVESDAPSPSSRSGELQAELERRVLAEHAGALIVRSSSASFCAWDRENLVTRALQSLRRGERWDAAGGHLLSPTYALDLAMATLDLLVDGEQGVWHLANQGAASWHGLLVQAAASAGVERRGLHALNDGARGQPERRTVLVSERGSVMPALEDALRRYVADSTIPPVRHRPGCGSATPASPAQSPRSGSSGSGRRTAGRSLPGTCRRTACSRSRRTTRCG